VEGDELTDVQPPCAFPSRLQCSGRIVQENTVLPAGIAVAETNFSWERRMEDAQP
jgi:hypothetical protein